MNQVVSLQPPVTVVAHYISVKFAKMDNARGKAQSLRVEIGRDLIELKRRVDAGEARKLGEPEEFWVWIKLRVDRSLQDMRKCIALAKARDPEAAAAQERDDNRAYQQKSRVQKKERADSQRPLLERSNSSPPAQVVSIDPVERAIDGLRGLTAGFTVDERKRFLARAQEEFPWLSGGSN